MKQYVIILIVFLLPINTIFGQQGKKVLDHNVYPNWKTVKSAAISNDGNWIMYEINPLKCDGYLYLVNPFKNIKDSIPRACDAQFSANSEFVVFKIKQPADSIRKLKLNKTKDEDLPKDSAGVWMLKNRSLKKFDNVKSFKNGKDGGDWVAFLLEEKKEKPEKKDTAQKADTSTLKPAEPKKDKKKGKKQSGTDLLIYNPHTEISYTNKLVTDYNFSKNGELLSMISIKKDSVDTVAVAVFRPDKLKTDTIFKFPGTAKNTVSDDAGKQMVFQYSQDTGKVKQYRLMYWKSKQENPKTIIDTIEAHFPKNWCLSEHQPPRFSDDGSLIYFGTAPRQYPEPKDTLLDDEKVKLDLWSWTDGLLQPQQLKELDKDKKKSYQAVYFVKDSTMVQLADSLIDNIRLLKNNYNIAYAYTEIPYEKLSSWESPSYVDCYITDVKTGKKEPVLKKQQYDVRMSPFGNYLLYYKIADSSWNVYSVKNKTHVCLTKKIPVNFYDEENDAPEEPSPYGIAGWTENDAFVMIYDKYDIWKIDPTMNVAPENISRNGRAEKIQYRYISTDREAEFIDTKMSLLLSIFDTHTRQSGFASLNLKNGKSPVKLIFDNYQMNFISKAKKSDKVIFSKQSFTQYPDVLYTNMNFSAPVKVSNTNPQQNDYYWGSVEMVNWTSTSGIKLEGLLYKPENFNPAKKYPVIVYFYERYSDQINQHWIPSPSRSIINPAIYCSNGYIVFMPDIRYKPGYPGKSAFDCVVSGTEYIKTFSFVDKDNIGIQGQSWGGYQVAYLVTQTDIYKAAMAGAAVTNMTSAYGGIRWESGMSRMFQYEESQSRIGATLWEDRDLYIQNSPVFYADKVKTPLLMMNNDNDGAVPWYQGIEFFTSLRRLDKPVWMLNYNGDAHNLEKWPNRIDLSIRMKQFFDHYLKGEPMPEWMKSGIPAMEKGKNTGYELTK
ncbi:MAG TPA: prolyl oligopeptidase family serine peptidase [Bacteroidales bacterium]|nr:prolyl oligopeptidase family serine peptidase [Bacteroidales bacterium]